jgi:hypothetical protein
LLRVGAWDGVGRMGRRRWARHPPFEARECAGPPQFGRGRSALHCARGHLALLRLRGRVILALVAQRFARRPLADIGRHPRCAGRFRRRGWIHSPLLQVARSAHSAIAAAPRRRGQHEHVSAPRCRWMNVVDSFVSFQASCLFGFCFLPTF